MAKICFYSCTDHPLVQGRTAHHHFEPLATDLNQMGHEAVVVGPSGDVTSSECFRSFDYLERFLRWFSSSRFDLVVFWTSKPAERWLATHFKRFHPDLRIAFAELGLTDQSGRIYLDPAGTGVESSLTLLEPTNGSGITPKLVSGDMPVGVVLQIAEDYQFQQNGVFPSNDEFVRFLLKKWPDEKFLVRPHPRDPSFHCCELSNVTITRDGTLDEFLCRVKCVAGVNSSALIHSGAKGYATYQFGMGIGHNAGCFLKGPISPNKVISKDPDSYDRCRRMAGLLDRIADREIPLSTGAEIRKAVARNVVLGNLD